MANLLSTIVSGRLSIGSSTATPYLTTAPDGIVFGGNEVGNAYRLYTDLENYGGNYTKLNIAWHTGIKIGAYYGYGGTRFYNNSPSSGTEIFSVGKGDNHVRVENNLYVGNTIYNNGNAVIHAGNIGSQSVNYASSAGNADTLDSLDSSEFARGRAAYQVLNLDTAKQPGLYQYDGGIGGTQPAGTNWYNVKTIEIGSEYRYSQFVMPYSENRIFYRYKVDAGWQPYVELITSGNISSQSVNYANSAGSANAVTWGNVSGKPSLDYQQEYTFTAPPSPDGSGYVWIRMSMGGFNGGGNFVKFSISRAIGWNGSSPYGGPSMDVVAYSREWHGGQEGTVITYAEHGSVPGSGFITNAGPRDLAGGGYWFYMRVWAGIDYAMRVYRGSGPIGTAWEETTDPTRVYALRTGVNNIGDVHIGFNTNGDVYGSRFYDYNDTAFYVDPNSSSRLRNLYVGDSGSNWVDTGGWGTQLHVSNGPHSIIRVYARDEAIQTVLFSHNGGQSKVGSGTNHDFAIVRNFSDRMTFYSGYTYANGYLQAADSLRAPIFYDSGDTGYYLDPNDTSNLNQLNTATRARWNMPRYWTNRTSYSSDQGYWTGTNGWAKDHGTWANAWQGGFSGWDIWGEGTDHPQGAGYVHAQGIVSGQHYATSSVGYGWMMVGAANATDNRYWLRGKWDTTTSGWVEMITTGNIGSQSVNYAASAGDASTLGGFGRGNTTNKVAYFDGTRNLFVNNPESYTGEVRLGAAWSRGGVYASSTLSMATSGGAIDFVSNDTTIGAFRWDSTNGSRFIVGENVTTTPYTLIDSNKRPVIYQRGQYPVLTLDHTVTSNGVHGPTIQFVHNGYQGNQWVIGTNGPGTRLDIGFSNTAEFGNTSYNPHNGIGGYNGKTLVRMTSAGVAIGSLGTYPTVIEPAYTLDVRGNSYSSGNLKVDGFVNVNGATEHTVNDNGSVVHGTTTNNRVFINGSIQLTNNNDAIVIGRGTSTFLTDEEIGFGWGGGWYMTEGSYIRSRGSKSLHMNGGSVDYVGSLYLDGAVGVHLQPNAGSYGSLQVTGSKDGWHGIRFTGSNVVVMANGNEVGFHNNNAGWQFRWYGGEMYISANSTGGGTERTVIHSGNIGSQSVNYATSAGSSSSSSRSSALDIVGYGSGNMTYYQSSGTFAGQSGWAGYFISNHGDGATYYNQTIIMPFWGAPQYSRLQGGTFVGPYTFWTTENLNDYAPNMNQYVRTSDNVTFNTTTASTTTAPIILVNNHSDNTKGYRIHNTSGSSVSAMFTNSSNQLVIAAGAVDQINLNKKVYVNGVALGVNVTPSATAGRIDASNDIVAYSSSDERLKYNITPIENAIDKVKSLTGVEFDWKPEYKHAHGYEGHDTGIIAQQVQEVIPSAVRTNDTGFLAVRYEKLIGLLIEANKELAARVEELEKKLG